MMRLMFNRLSNREKMLLLAFVWFILIVWLTGVLEGLLNTSREWSTVTENLRMLEAEIAQAPEVEAELAEQMAVLDPELTLGGDDLAGRVDNIARRLGVQFILTPLSPDRNQEFDIYKLKIQIRRAKLEDHLAFSDAILQESPYMKIENVRLSADNRDPNFITGTFVINSFELQPETPATL